MSRKLEPDEAQALFATQVKKAKYPWDQWADGSAWLLKRGEDYTVTDRAIRVTAAANARKRNLRVRTAMTEEGVVIQFLPRSTPQAANRGTRIRKMPKRGKGQPRAPLG